jgi:hypothetical protein
VKGKKGKRKFRTKEDCPTPTTECESRLPFCCQSLLGVGFGPRSAFALVVSCDASTGMSLARAGGTEVWFSPQFAAGQSDSNYASIGTWTGGETTRLALYGFNRLGQTLDQYLPANADIKGIEVSVARITNGNLKAIDVEVQLFNEKFVFPPSFLCV